MGKAVVTFKLMPTSVDVDLEPVKEKALALCREAGSIGDMRGDLEPVAFGLKSVIIKAMFEVDGADFDGMAEKMNALDGVQTAEVAGMDLALG